MKLTGWGRYPVIEGVGRSFETIAQLSRVIDQSGDWIPHAMGRSYGDSSLNSQVVFSRRFDKILDFDADKGIVTCESGVTLAELIRLFLPRGWFLSVTPGTKFISVGGAIASDVHGKNHHQAGCFSESVQFFDLMLPSGEVIRCDHENNKELFLATCGGMGLTGVVLAAAIRLQRIQSSLIKETIIRCKNLEEIFARFEESNNVPYSMAWIDCLAKRENIGRSVLMRGRHASSGPLKQPNKIPLVVPFTPPGIILNRFSVKVFNELVYRKYPRYAEDLLVPMENFFYPLDSIGQWNRMYGRKGFTQYQFVLPKESSLSGIRKVLHRIASAGLGSFLGVLKLFGSENNNYLSFPMQGYTLALDFKIEPRLFPFLDELDRIVLDHSGRLYLTKDVRMSEKMFKQSYPNWEKFKQLRHHHGAWHKFNSIQSKRLEI